MTQPVLATHILGLTLQESGTLISSTRSAEEKAAATAQIAARWQEIQQQGVLLARDYQPGREPGRLHAPSRSFDWDEFAGDGAFVFLSTGYQYGLWLPAAAYGWQFDARQLVARGALVGDRDLGEDYDDAISEVCEDLATTLLPPTPPTEEDRAMLAELLGEDFDLLDEAAAFASNPARALHDALYDASAAHDLDPQVVEKTRALALQRCRALQAAHRFSGSAAAALLQDGGACEILVPRELPLDLAIALIKAGKRVA